MRDYGLEGKVAVVTGGSRGIGAAIVWDLAENGADVAFTYRTQLARAEEVASAVRALGRKVLPIQADAGSFSDAQRVISETLQAFGHIDILVNNAGVNRDSVVWKMSEDDWDIVLNTNLKGYFNMVRVVAPLFKEQKSGRIVNITSINGLRGKFGQSNYAAAKAGIIGFTKSVARELGPFGVTVNAVAPGLIETDMVRSAPESVREKALAEIVLGRLGTPEDVAFAVTFLCSERARHITGEVLRVDGGQYI
ncbi:MAG: 3-oxoacyl-ACP reductase family protein [bacterium JZ-2024 1]